ncbi:MAG: hypothetical protein J5601_02495 [Elusimicrobiaceae bacterium]|nr:hypothetical protein [Elusimicrobiaceae bacterium]
MKKFVYQVKGYEFSDTEAFGTAWKEAKAKATELNAPIFRLVIKNGEAKQEFFAKGGVFLSVKFYTEDKVLNF